MTAEQALQFAFDWPAWPFLNPRCVTCGRGVRRANLIEHLDSSHPGWLDAWNDVLCKCLGCDAMSCGLPYCDECPADNTPGYRSTIL